MSDEQKAAAAPIPWTVREVRSLHKIIVEHDGLFPTICELTYMDFNRETALKRAELIARAPELLDENERLRRELGAMS